LKSVALTVLELLAFNAPSEHTQTLRCTIRRKHYLRDFNSIT